MNTYANFKDQDSTTADNLLAGEFPRSSSLVTITGASYVRGSVLGKVTTSAEYTLSVSTATNGSQTPCAILAENVDASSEDKQAVVYFTGEFNGAALTLGGSHTLDSIADSLRAKSIFIKNNQPY